VRTTDLLRFLRTAALCAAVAGFATKAGAQTCTIDGTSAQQTIDGFGFSTAWSGRLSSAQGDVLFGTGNGQLGFSLLRIRIDPTQAWSDETNNSTVAHARGAKVLGTPWTPPASMKTNNNTVHGSLQPSQYGAFATYLNKAATSIGLDFVSIQNEPDYDPTWEGCTWTPENLHTFVLNNASAIGKPLVMPEGTDFKDTYSDPTLNDSSAASKVTVVAGHFYNEGNTNNGNYVHTNAISKGKRVWMTEHYFSGTDIGTCMSVAKELSDAMNNQFNAYIWWWMSNGGDGNFITGTTPMKNGYTLGQFARFVRPGMTRIGATYSPRSNVYVTAYTGGSSLVVIAVNTGTAAVSQPFALQGISGVTALTPVRTSASENMAQLAAVAVSSGSFTASLPAQSITTFVGTTGGNTGGDTQPPTAPGTPAASSVTSSSVVLSWTASTDNVGVTGYTVYQRTSSGDVSVATPSTASTSISGLSASTSYTFYVKARDAAGNSSVASPTVTVTTSAGGGGGGGGTTGDCTATFSSSAWNNGFTGTVTVKAGAAAINGWTVTLSLGSNTITQVWSATQSGSTFKNLSYNGALAAGGSTTFGFNGSFSGSFSSPTVVSCTSP
jgi:glucuronoarabinoxylan endo-1,4-beta-xylanase